ncbi:hypothetical protein EV183_002156 [Coemansia sp. RSA 2336]|nr:hypothetical protein EV183_002156 [Coemansia sp. RSA 2336]
MSALESLNVLNNLTKHKTPKRIRKERAKKTIQSLVRKPGTPKQPAAAPKPQAPQVEEPSLRDRNAATLRAADRMVRTSPT